MENQNHAFNYAYLLKQVKARVLLAQKKAIYTANEEMLSMYWDIGKLLSESQKQRFFFTLVEDFSSSVLF